MNLDTLLQETGTVPDPSLHTLAGGHATLDAAAAVASCRVTAIRRTRRRRRLGLGALVSAAATAALVIGPTIGTGGGGPTATAAAQVLLEASAAAGEQGGGWPDAAYWHTVKDVTAYYTGAPVTERRESWMARVGDSVIQDSPGLDRFAWTVGWHGWVGGQMISWADLYALPNDPDALEQLLREGPATELTDIGPDDGDKPSPAEVLFHNIGDLLRESPASPALREALWAVAAGLPGVTLIGDVTDAAGRPGIAVQSGINRLVIDPDDGRLLEWWNIYPTAPGEPLDVRVIETFIEEGPADTAPLPDEPPTR